MSYITVDSSTSSTTVLVFDEKLEILKKLEPIVSESFNVFLELPLKIINRNLKYKIIPINWFGRKIGKSKFRLNELRSKYIFTLIYCFSEKILLLKK